MNYPTSPRKENTSVSKLTVEYLKKFGKNRDLQQYFVLSTPLSTSQDNFEQMEPKSPSSILIGSKKGPLWSDLHLPSTSDDRKTPEMDMPVVESVDTGRLSSASSVMSDKRLEWDSGADVGYVNYYNNKYKEKSLSLPALSTIDSSGENSNSSRVRKKKKQTTFAESTPSSNIRNFFKQNETEITAIPPENIEETTIMPKKVESTLIKDKSVSLEDTRLKPEVVASKTLSQTDLPNVEKSSIIENMYIFSPTIIKNLKDEAHKSDKIIQTSLEKTKESSLSEAEAFQTALNTESPTSEKYGTFTKSQIPASSSFEYIPGHQYEAKRSDNNDSSSPTPKSDNEFEMLKSSLKKINISDQVTLKSCTSSSYTTKSTDSEVSNAESSGHSIGSILMGSQYSTNLTKDLEHTVEAMKNIMEAKQYSEEDKKRLIRKIVKKIVSTNYDEDQEKVIDEEILSKNVPWTPVSLNSTKNTQSSSQPSEIVKNEIDPDDKLSWKSDITSSEKIFTERIKYLQNQRHVLRKKKRNIFTNVGELQKKISKDILDKGGDTFSHVSDAKKKKLLKITEKERENQLEWVKSEIYYLNQLRSLLEDNFSYSQASPTQVYTLFANCLKKKASNTSDSDVTTAPATSSLKTSGRTDTSEIDKIIQDNYILSESSSKKKNSKTSTSTDRDLQNKIIANIHDAQANEIWKLETSQNAGTIKRRYQNNFRHGRLESFRAQISVDAEQDNTEVELQTCFTELDCNASSERNQKLSYNIEPRKNAGDLGQKMILDKCPSPISLRGSKGSSSDVKYPGRRKDKTGNEVDNDSTKRSFVEEREMYYRCCTGPDSNSCNEQKGKLSQHIEPRKNAGGLGQKMILDKCPSPICLRGSKGSSSDAKYPGRRKDTTSKEIDNDSTKRSFAEGREIYSKRYTETDSNSSNEQKGKLSQGAKSSKNAGDIGQKLRLYKCPCPLPDTKSNTGSSDAKQSERRKGTMSKEVNNDFCKRSFAEGKEIYCSRYQEPDSNFSNEKTGILSQDIEPRKNAGDLGQKLKLDKCSCPISLRGSNGSSSNPKQSGRRKDSRSTEVDTDSSKRSHAERREIYCRRYSGPDSSSCNEQNRKLSHDADSSKNASDVEPRVTFDKSLSPIPFPESNNRRENLDHESKNKECQLGEREVYSKHPKKSDQIKITVKNCRDSYTQTSGRKTNSTSSEEYICKCYKSLKVDKQIQAPCDTISEKSSALSERCIERLLNIGIESRVPVETNGISASIAIESPKTTTKSFTPPLLICTCSDLAFADSSRSERNSELCTCNETTSQISSRYSPEVKQVLAKSRRDRSPTLTIRLNSESSPSSTSKMSKQTRNAETYSTWPPHVQRNIQFETDLPSKSDRTRDRPRFKHFLQKSSKDLKTQNEHPGKCCCLPKRIPSTEALTSKPPEGKSMVTKKCRAHPDVSKSPLLIYDVRNVPTYSTTFFTHKLPEPISRRSPDVQMYPTGEPFENYSKESTIHSSHYSKTSSEIVIQETSPGHSSHSYTNSVQRVYNNPNFHTKSECSHTNDLHKKIQEMLSRCETCSKHKIEKDNAPEFEQCCECYCQCLNSNRPKNSLDQCTCTKNAPLCNSCKLNSERYRQNSIAYFLRIESREDLFIEERPSSVHRRTEIEEVKIYVPKFLKHGSNIIPNSNAKYIEEIGLEHPEKSAQSLKEYLLRNKPEFIHASVNRQEYLKEIATERIKTVPKRVNSRSSSEPKFKTTPKKKKMFTSKKMKDMTLKKYRTLPEVEQKKYNQQLFQQRRSNRLMVELFNKKLQQRVHKGEMDLSLTKTLL